MATSSSWYFVLYSNSVYVYFAMFTRTDKFALPNRLAWILFLVHTRLLHSSQNAVYVTLSKELAKLLYLSDRSMRRMTNFSSKSMFSTTSCFFFFCQETIYWKVAFVFPFHALKQSSRAFNHSFISIAFAQYRVIMWWKNNEGSPWIRASGRSRKKRSNFAGFSGTNSRKKRPISREFRGNFSGQFRWKTIGKERPIS